MIHGANQPMGAGGPEQGVLGGNVPLTLSLAKVYPSTVVGHIHALQLGPQDVDDLLVLELRDQCLWGNFHDPFLLTRWANGK